MRRLVEIMWLVISAVSLIEMIVGYKESRFNNENFKLFAILFVASTFMYFLRRRQRNKIEDRKKNNSQSF